MGSVLGFPALIEVKVILELNTLDWFIKIGKTSGFFLRVSRTVRSVIGCVLSL